MIELRWTVLEGTNTKAPVLQFRVVGAVDASGAFCPGAPGLWQDVPFAVVPPVPGPPSHFQHFPRCSTKLREAGLTYPRTCEHCGLGPCRA